MFTKTCRHSCVFPDDDSPAKRARKELFYFAFVHVIREKHKIITRYLAYFLGRNPTLKTLIQLFTPSSYFLFTLDDTSSITIHFCPCSNVIAAGHVVDFLEKVSTNHCGISAHTRESAHQAIALCFTHECIILISVECSRVLQSHMQRGIAQFEFKFLSIFQRFGEPLPSEGGSLSRDPIQICDRLSCILRCLESAYSRAQSIHFVSHRTE